MPRTAFLVCCLLLPNVGCSKSQPTLAGGKSVDHWVQLLESGQPAERKSAAFKLGNVGDAAPAVVPALRKALNDPDATVRCECILALVKCRGKAAEIVPVLAEVEKQDKDKLVRSYAAQAIESLQTPR